LNDLQNFARVRAVAETTRLSELLMISHSRTGCFSQLFCFMRFLS